MSGEVLSAAQVVYDGLRNPTEYESTPIIAHVLQEYILRLMGRYREFIQPEGTPRAGATAAPAEDQAQVSPSGQQTLEGIRARPSFRQSPKAQSGRAGADDDGFLRSGLGLLQGPVMSQHPSWWSLGKSMCIAFMMCVLFVASVNQISSLHVMATIVHWP